jgi:probable phosphoglycerate mutase
MASCWTILLLGALSAAPPTSLAGLGPVPADTVRLFFIRHAQAFSNLTPRPALTAAELDRLTSLGRTQAERAAAALRGHGVRAVLPSPAGRSRETAQVIAQALGLSVGAVEPRIRSMELGRSPDGKALGWDEREAEWRVGRDAAPPGGESLRQVADRQLELLADLARDRPGPAVVLVSHGEVIAALVGDLEGRPIARWQEEHVANGSITVVDAKAGERPRLVRWNVVP